MLNIDLFAGVGGFHQGWALNGVETVWASEWNKSSRETYATNYGLVPDGDITQISAAAVPKHDVLSAGFPCQAFSVSGKQLGFADTRGTLFFDVARVAKQKRPTVVFLENVKNFASHDNGKTLSTVLSVLCGLGYDVYWKVLSAKDYGVPQDRKRIYIVGFREGAVNSSGFAWPEPEPLRRSVKDTFEPKNDVPESVYVRREDLRIDWGKVEQYDDLVVPAGKPLRVGSVGKGGQGERVYHYNGCSVTLSSHGGGVGAKTGLYYTPEGDIRKLTPREAARLMGFPESFVPNVSTSQALQHFGNAVVVDVVHKIGKNILEALSRH